MGYRFGDVNLDYQIDVLDITRTVNIIMESGPIPSEDENYLADPNMDGVIDISDAIIFVHIILVNFQNDGFVQLENQSEHSGIRIVIDELDIWHSTDSTGYFNIGYVPTGEWNITIEYPYFLDQHVSMSSSFGHLGDWMDLELIQQLLFWIWPNEITVPYSGEGFSVDAVGHVQNISQHPITLSCDMGNNVFFSISPQDHEWDDEIEMQGFDHFCYINYECFSNGGFDCYWSLELNPGEVYNISGLEVMLPYNADCIVPGIYKGYWFLTDDGHYPEYFWLWYGGEFMPGELYENLNPLNRSISKKDYLSLPILINHNVPD